MPSLVGSEMCIRDRATTAQAESATAAAAAAAVPGIACLRNNRGVVCCDVGAEEVRHQGESSAAGRDPGGKQAGHASRTG